MTQPSKKFYLSHVYVVPPTPEYWDPLPYISFVNENTGPVFRKGMQGWREWTEADLQGMVECGEVVPILPHVELGENDEVFLLDSGEVAVADKTLAKGDPNWRIVGRLPQEEEVGVPYQPRYRVRPELSIAHLVLILGSAFCGIAGINDARGLNIPLLILAGFFLVMAIVFGCVLYRDHD